MICLTGDIHHQALGTGNQQHCEHTEVDIARRYLDLLRNAGVKVTFFVSGRTFVDQWDELRPIVTDPLVEVGGHNFDCFQPAIVSRVWKKIDGSYAGPAWMEQRDVDRTMAVIRNKTGRDIRVWRNHMYMHGPRTLKILASRGIIACSDRVSATATRPAWTEHGIAEAPINVIPDHEHLFHAERTPEWVARWQARYGWKDAFGSDSYHIEQWADLVLEQLAANEARGAVSTMIIHPITMWLCDRFRAFERILEYVASRQSAHLGDVIAASPRPTFETLYAQAC
jgi:peptidoglycan/xylan/chitin deacetylase (PgdA/CDA1 family)